MFKRCDVLSFRVRKRSLKKFKMYFIPVFLGSSILSKDKRLTLWEAIQASVECGDSILINSKNYNRSANRFLFLQIYFSSSSPS